MMVIRLRNLTEMTQYNERNRDLIYRLIHKRIEENLHTDVESVHIFDILLTDYNMSVENRAFRTEWGNMLQKAMAYFEGTEDYETCLTIQQTMKKL